MPTITELESEDAGPSSTSVVPRPKHKFQLLRRPQIDAKLKPKVDTVLSNASSVLNAAQQIAPLIPVPFVASIFSSAKVIIDEVQVSIISFTSHIMRAIGLTSRLLCRKSAKTRIRLLILLFGSLR